MDVIFHEIQKVNSISHLSAEISYDFLFKRDEGVPSWNEYKEDLREDVGVK